MVHAAEIAAFRFSPQGDQLASAQLDGSVRVWNLADGRVRFAFPPGAGALKDFSHWVERMRIHDWANLAFSPDGKHLLCGVNANTARLWDMDSGQLLREFPHKNLVVTVEFSPDAGQVLSASRDHTVWVWDVRSGKPVAKEQWHPTIPFQAHFSPDGSRVATGSSDNTISIWNAANGESPYPPLLDKSAAVRSLRRVSSLEPKKW